MKKLARAMALLLCWALFLSACSARSATPSTSQDPILSAGEAPVSGAQIAYIVAEGDGEATRNQEVWNAVSRFAGENGLTSGSYKASANDLDAALATVELAVKGGADLLIFQGEGMAQAAAQAQIRHIGIHVLLLDMPADATLLAGTVRVAYNPEQGGWLAGYAAVTEGARSLGFAVGEDETARRYALGFLLGAQAAAEELALKEPLAAWPLADWADIPSPEGEDSSAGSTAPSDVDATGQNAGADEDSAPQEGEDEKEMAPEVIEQQAAQVLAGGEGLLFANDRALLAPLLAAAKDEEGSLICIGDEGLVGSRALLTSVQNHPRGVLTDLLTSWRDGTFPGGEVVYGSVAGGDVSLQVEDSRLKSITARRYEELAGRFAEGGLAAELERTVTGDGTQPVTPEALELSLIELVRPVQPGAGSVSAPPAAGRGTAASSGSTQGTQPNPQATPPALEPEPDPATPPPLPDAETQPLPSEADSAPAA